jgi:putative aldouronate transport system substrate-binding protein
LTKKESQSGSGIGFSDFRLRRNCQTPDFNEWDEVKELNEKATPSVLLGFTLDVEPFRDQLTNCAEIYTRYQAELLTGTSDPEEAVPQMKAEMEKAGLNDVIEGAQKQVDEFLKK